MIDIDEFHEILTEVCAELPQDMFDKLHHGVILEEEVKISPHSKNDDLVILGEYSRTGYGNKISIYYGSFARSFPMEDREFIKEKLRGVVRHEFRHHMENLSGMHGADSLEREDEVRLKAYIRGE